MPTKTFSTQASGTGVVYLNPISGAGNKVWDNVHDAADGGGTGSANVAPRTGKSADGYFWVNRAFLAFDTSVLTTFQEITAVIVRITVSGKQELDDGHANLIVVEGVQGTPLVVANYGDHLAKTTEGGSIDYDDIDGSGTSDITLNSTGRGWINKAGVTKLCLRVSGDVSDLEPVGTGGIGNGITVLSASLIVTYSLKYPTNDLGRIGSLVHRRDVDAGIYTLEMTFGGIRFEPPSTVPAVGAGASGYGGVDEPTMVEMGLPTPIPEPPRRILGDITPTPFIRLQGATQYARARAQELYEMGFVDAGGAPTAKGLDWAKAHPTEEAPRKYTAEKGHLQERMEYLRAEMLEFQRRTGRAPRVYGAEDIMKGQWAYTPVSRLSAQVGSLLERTRALRTREQILADIAAGRRTTTGGGVTTRYSPSTFQRKLANLQRRLAESRSGLGRQSIQRAINRLIQEQRGR